MAITIQDTDNFKLILTPQVIDWDSDQLDPCFAVFKRINKITALKDYSDNFIAKLQMIDKASVRIDSLDIDKYVLREMSEFYKEKEVNLIIESLQLDNCNIDHLSDKEAKFINKINPKMLRINENKWTVDNIKALALFNSTNIDVNFKDNIMKGFSFWFVKTPIQLFDFDHNQSLAFEWESIEIFIEKDKIENVKLFKTNNSNFLFIPLDTIGGISCSGFREIFSSNEIIKQFADLGAQHKFEDSGLIVPTRYSKRIFILLDESELDFLKQIKYINKIFKEKDIKLATWRFESWLEIKKKSFLKIFIVLIFITLIMVE